jgi:hypothetical protein
VEILPLEEAVKRISAKTPIGSVLRSADWEKVPLALRERAQFSAGVTSARVLQAIQDRLQGQISLQREKLASGKEATFDRSSFIDAVRDIARDEGLKPEAGSKDKGTLRDITSISRLGLIYDMQNQMATGFARWKMDQSEGALMLYPAWEFKRVEDRRVPREEMHPGFWTQRWVAAAGDAGDEGALRIFQDAGRKVALKTSGIWAALSRFGTPWAPFDYQSGMGVEDVDREEAVALGLIKEDEVPEAKGEEDFNENLQASVKGIDPELQDFLRDNLGDQVVIEGDTAYWKGQESKPPPPGPPPPPPAPPPIAPSELVIPPKPEAAPVTEAAIAVNGVGDRLRKLKFGPELVAATNAIPARAAELLANAAFKKIRGGAKYRWSERGVMLNGDPKNWSGRPFSLHHESGHHIHYELGIVTEAAVRADFKSALAEDLAGFKVWAEKKFGADWGKKFKRGNREMLGLVAKELGMAGYDQIRDLDGAQRTVRVTDTLSGASGAAYGLGHSPGYMRRGTNGAMEAFANAYSAIVQGDEGFQRLFPKIVALIRKELML